MNTYPLHIAPDPAKPKQSVLSFLTPSGQILHFITYSPYHALKTSTKLLEIFYPNGIPALDKLPHRPAQP